MTVWADYNYSSPFPNPTGNLGNVAANNLAKASGWSNPWGNTWTNPQKPGQYLSSGNLSSMLGKQQEATRLSNPGSFNSGVDYMALLSPYLSSAGKTADSSSVGTNRYREQLKGLSANPNSIADTESYKFRLGQGQKALERSLAAKGMSASGNALASLLEYGQGMASTEYGTEFDRLLKASQNEDSFNLGKANLDNQSAQVKNSLANLVLEAGKAKSGDYWKAVDTASKNAIATGYLNPQFSNIW